MLVCVFTIAAHCHAQGKLVSDHGVIQKINRLLVGPCNGPYMEEARWGPNTPITNRFVEGGEISSKPSMCCAAATFCLVDSKDQ